MSQPFVAEIRMVPFNFMPSGWARCDGQILSIWQNTALFSLLGTTYGGNGESTFALPNLQGMMPMHPGQGPGLSLHDLGEMGGSSEVTLLASEIPSHTHALVATSDAGDDNDPNSSTTFATVSGGGMYNTAPAQAGSGPAFHSDAIGVTGGGLPHNNLQPYLVVTFMIALQGVFPPRG